MTEQEVFKHLFSISSRSNDTRGVVTSCLVRDGEILADGVSMSGGIHSEYTLLQTLKKKNISVLSGDIFYTTVEPCGKRTPGGAGEKMGDCTTNLIQAGVKHVIYAASDPDASAATRHKFVDAGVTCEQASDRVVTDQAIELFNSTNSDLSGHLF